jgi:N-methylhydantoinase A
MISVETINSALDSLDVAALDARMVASGGKAGTSSPPRVWRSTVDVHYELDMHYVGQTHTVGVLLP